MTKRFAGFSHGPFNMTQIPVPFFTEIMPLVDDVAEMKVVLFCFWALPQKEGRYPYLRRRDFTNNESLMQALSGHGDDPEQVLDAALARAVEHGILLAPAVRLDQQETLYFMNSVRGRSAEEQIKAGRWQAGDEENPVEILPERPNIFHLYEQNVGQLTPMIAEHLKEMEQDYPPTWIGEAIGQAVRFNKRNLSYIQAILERWREEGKDSGEQFAGRRDEEDSQRYLSGPYADFINH